MNPSTFNTLIAELEDKIHNNLTTNNVKYEVQEICYKLFAKPIKEILK